MSGGYRTGTQSCEASSPNRVSGSRPTVGYALAMDSRICHVDSCSDRCANTVMTVMRVWMVAYRTLSKVITLILLIVGYHTNKEFAYKDHHLKKKNVEH